MYETKSKCKPERENSWKAYISVRLQSESPQQHFEGNLVPVAAQPKTDMNSSD
jgi:hypothetical protein